MYYLAKLFPKLEEVRLPLTRDQLMLLMAAVNEIFLGIDIYLAHKISGTIVPNEWIPIIFGPAAGVLLLIAGVIAIRRRAEATVLANLVFLSSIGVGLLGAYFHLRRALLPFAPAGEQFRVSYLVWAPPVVGPLVFSLVGVLGISAVWREDPPDSGVLRFFGERKLRLPYSKTRAFLFLVSLGTLATVFSSTLDHARTPFTNPWLWVPFVVGVIGVIAPYVLALIDQPSKADLAVYLAAMVLLILVGVTGMTLHILENLTPSGIIVQERFIRGAPFLAPMLYANIGALGILTLLDPREPGRDD